MGGETLKLLVVLVVILVEGKWVAGAGGVHHVAGGDRGWDPSSDVASWSDGRVFRVGDKIWFTYSAAEETIVELRSMDEYLSCDVTNPIKMFTDGLDIVPLDGEGIRYFASGKPESCKNGLKLHVDVKPIDRNGPQKSDVVLAAGPKPSDSAHLSGLSGIFIFGLLLSYMGL